MVIVKNRSHEIEIIKWLLVLITILKVGPGELRVKWQEKVFTFRKYPFAITKISNF